jgi:oligopeptide/dipeptide ABC transporter ATP-binding protein
MLEIENLVTRYTVSEDGTNGAVDAVDDVSFAIDEGEIFGLVGESGCGKSTIAQSVMRILPDNGAVVNGDIRFDGRDLTEIPEAEMRAIRWEEIAIVSQSAMNAFDPVYTVGQQIREAIDVHRNVSREAKDDRIADLFETVGIDPERASEYPHQFSGGMKQRAMIAMALVLEPDLIIADEPTTALDVISQDTILHYLERLQAETGAAVLLITHDMSVVAELCDRTGVMYAGKLAEVGPTESVFLDPRHPYTMGLKNAFPSTADRTTDLVSIPGSPPDLLAVEDGCRFASRCPFAIEDCRAATPPLEATDDPDHATACIRHDEVGPDELRRRAANASTWQESSAARADGSGASTSGVGVESSSDSSGATETEGGSRREKR